MSRGQLARTPENFPKMKHRAAGRLARRRKQAAKAVTLADALKAIGDVVQSVLAGMSNVAEAITQLFQTPQVKSDYILWPPPPTFKLNLPPMPTFNLRNDL